jgi:hypothetical protein
MPRVGFEPTVPASARMKTVHTLDRAATVTGILSCSINIFLGSDDFLSKKHRIVTYVNIVYQVIFLFFVHVSFPLISLIFLQFPVNTCWKLDRSNKCMLTSTEFKGLDVMMGWEINTHTIMHSGSGMDFEYNKGTFSYVTTSLFQLSSATNLIKLIELYILRYMFRPLEAVLRGMMIKRN